MSSSRVFKPGQLNDSRICNVNYEVLMGKPSPDGESPGSYFEGDGFTPLFFNDCVGPQSSSERNTFSADGSDVSGGGEPEGVGESVAEGMLVLPEDELHRQVADAYARGLEEGRLAAERGLGNVFRALREGLESLHELREKVVRESEGDLLKLAIMISRKIIMQELTLDPQILASIVSTTVGCCSELDRITIRLNPDDHKAVLANRQRYFPSDRDDGRITLASDVTIRIGGCLIETPTGTVDSRIETQLEEIFLRCLEEGGLPAEPSIRLADEV
jgi:flagellar assembly protein FliH